MIKKINNLIAMPRAHWSYKRKKTRLKYLPTALWIEPTNVCNLKCIMCPNSIIGQPNPGYMDFDLYKKIIDEAKPFVSFIILCISGESLLHPKFPEMVKYAKDNKIAVYISTNCTLLTPEISRKLLEADLDWINFFFDGVTKEVYEKVRVNANFEKSLENVINFLKIKKELGAKTVADLQVMIMDDEGDKIYQENREQFMQNFKDLPIDCIQMRRPSTWGNFLSDTDKFEAKELGKEFSPCSYLWSSMHIQWDGHLIACTSDFFGDNKLGKFPEHNLKQLWNSDQMVAFRESMLNNTYLSYNKNCEKCDSIWEKQILSFPAGMRGIFASTLNSIFHYNFYKPLKKIAKFVNKDFAMNVTEEDKKKVNES
ncbi:radical SAM protein [Candidatus Falkowbacteria bacterium]|jgi:radical SAM protein with 4Fe4S-binding SPASM domain|nr:radical SAM protein [Candidatus Falkowbacteria bacterium]MBT6573484.1 radical SAM protein [Candidatus Falkowbacteria bacterium]